MTSPKQIERNSYDWNPEMPSIKSELLPPLARETLIEAARKAKVFGTACPPKRLALIDEAILAVTTQYPEYFRDDYRKEVLAFFANKKRK